MAQTKLIGVDNSIQTADPNISQEYLDAVAYTETFANAVARKSNPDPSSWAYFWAMSQECQKIGWNVKKADRSHFDNSGGGKTTGADIITKMLSPYLDATGKAALDGLLSAMRDGNTSAGVNDFLTFFWNKSNLNVNKSSMAIGQVRIVDNAPYVNMMYYGFNFSEENWRCLFVGRDTSSLNVDCYYLEMNLNWPLWLGEKDTLIAKLSGKEKNHIQEADLDL